MLQRSSEYLALPTFITLEQARADGCADSSLTEAHRNLPNMLRERACETNRCFFARVTATYASRCSSSTASSVSMLRKCGTSSSSIPASQQRTQRRLQDGRRLRLQR